MERKNICVLVLTRIMIPGTVSLSKAAIDPKVSNQRGKPPYRRQYPEVSKKKVSKHLL